MQLTCSGFQTSQCKTLQQTDVIKDAIRSCEVLKIKRKERNLPGMWANIQHPDQHHVMEATMFYTEGVRSRGKSTPAERALRNDRQKDYRRVNLSRLSLCLYRLHACLLGMATCLQPVIKTVCLFQILWRVLKLGLGRENMEHKLWFLFIYCPIKFIGIFEVYIMAHHEKCVPAHETARFFSLHWPSC